jgi:hypothetical protein
MSSATQGLVQEADSAVNAMSRRRHLAQSPTSSARLSAAAPFVARLSHVTDMAVDARLALLKGSSLEIWDLRTGRHARLTNRPPVLEGTSNDSPPVVVGNSLLLVGVSDDAAPSAAVLLPLDGGPAVPLPATTVGYAPAGGDGVWLFTGDTVRRYDTHGKPVGPARPVPHGAQVGGLVGTADTVVLNVGSFDATPHTVLWHPASGRQQVLNADCGSGMAGARRTVVFVDCSQRSIDATDVETGEMRRVRLPRGLVADGIVVAAPDGRRAAFSVSRIADDSGVNDPLLAIVDFGTRAVTVLARPATALCWSADGLTLLAQTDGSSTVDTLPPLGYWSTGMRDLGSIRCRRRGSRRRRRFCPVTFTRETSPSCAAGAGRRRRTSPDGTASPTARRARPRRRTSCRRGSQLSHRRRQA